MVLIWYNVVNYGLQRYFSFRPLTGIMVLILAKDLKGYKNLMKRFRPLTGIMVLISITLTNTAIFSHGSFRPLTGIMVLINY